MILPPTYYDFVRKLRPYLVELAELDAKDLLASSDSPPAAIHSVDDYKSRFNECIERVDLKAFADLSQQTGMSIEEIKRHIVDMPPQIKASFTGLYATVNHEYHCLVNFALAGKKSFHFSDNLSEHLANTEINLKSELVELPFPTCLFTFTSPAVINAMHNIRGDVGRWNVNTNGLDYSAPVSVFLTMHPADEGLFGRKLLMVAWHARLPEKSYLMLKRELYLGGNWTLEQALRTDWQKLTPDNLGPGVSLDIENGNIGHQTDDSFYTDGLAFYRIILNALLYLSSDQAELIAKTSPRAQIEANAKAILSMPKRRKAMQTAGRYSELDYQEVGSSVGAIVIHQGEAESTFQNVGGGKPMARFMVRGHWRQQPHGTGNQERKLIWIRPYYKGPDLATLINKPYL